ncbi:MAG: hypothetical protein IKR04_01045 [Clostridia bacterium]|nr:hypothetical protein [Clostridia bacterium]
MLLSVGTKDEPKSKKFLQYWITGLILLIVIPYMLPAIPYISNQLVQTISDSAKSSSKYSMQEVARELDVEYRGEDAEVIRMVDILEEKIEKKRRELSGDTTQLTADEARAKIIELMDRYTDTGTLSGLSADEKNEFKNKYLAVADKIYANVADWSSSEYSRKYVDDLYDIRDYIYNHHSTVQGFPDSSSSYFRMAKRDWLKVTNDPNISTEDMNAIDNELLVIANYLKVADNLDKNGRIIKSAIYNNAINKLKEILNKYYGSSESSARVESLNSNLTDGSFFGNFYRNIYKVGSSSGISPAFDEYLKALLQEKLELYEDMLASLSDPMIKLYSMAKEQGRVVYAVAWAILAFQIIAILFMYYKRVFVVILLVILFPVVMALYVIDKLGDGKAQSLSNWFKEFFVNCFIQFLHALVYILVVNLGIDICNIDPTRNWLFLIIAVTSLFPIERMIRQIVGLNSSTVGGLKNNIMGIVLAGAALKKTGQNITNMGANAAKKGAAFGKDIKEQHDGGKSYKAIAGEKLSEAKKKVKENMQKPAQEVQAKRAKKTQMRQSRSDNRAYRQQAASEARTAIKNGVGTVGDRIDIARGAVANVTGAVSNTMNKVRNSKVGRVGAKLSMGASYAKAYGGKALKKTAGAYRKVAGTAAGVVTGLENAADSAANNGEGFLAGVTTGRKAIHEFGGYKDHKKAEDKDKKETPSNFTDSFASRSGAMDGGSASGGELPGSDGESLSFETRSEGEESSAVESDTREAASDAAEDLAKSAEGGEDVPTDAEGSDEGASEGEPTESAPEMTTEEKPEEGDSSGDADEPVGESGDSSEPKSTMTFTEEGSPEAPISSTEETPPEAPVSESAEEDPIGPID